MTQGNGGEAMKAAADERQWQTRAEARMTAADQRGGNRGCDRMAEEEVRRRRQQWMREGMVVKTKDLDMVKNFLLLIRKLHRQDAFYV